MPRKPVNKWTPESIVATYAIAHPTVRGRVTQLVDAAVSSGRFLTIETAGPAFGFTSAGGDRFLSIRETYATDRKARIAYFPRSLQGKHSVPRAADAEVCFRSLGMSCNAYASVPGHIELGTVDSLNNEDFEKLVAFLTQPY